MKSDGRCSAGSRQQAPLLPAFTSLGGVPSHPAHVQSTVTVRESSDFNTSTTGDLRFFLVFLFLVFVKEGLR